MELLLVVWAVDHDPVVELPPSADFLDDFGDAAFLGPPVLLVAGLNRPAFYIGYSFFRVHGVLVNSLLILPEVDSTPPGSEVAALVGLAGRLLIVRAL